MPVERSDRAGRPIRYHPFPAIGWRGSGQDVMLPKCASQSCADGTRSARSRSTTASSDSQTFPEVPGIYRFDLGDRVYVGEADRLRRRFQHYRTPGPSQATNIRVNAAMLLILEAGRATPVSTGTEAQVDIDGAVSELDLR